MLEAILRWRALTTWLLCAFILSAGLDKVPDPPALRPGRKEVRTLRLDHHPQRSPHQVSRPLYSVPDAFLPLRCLDLERVIDTGDRTPSAALVRQASGSSPPFPAA